MKAPPAVIGGLYVLEFAHVDDTIQFEQRYTLNVGGAWLGRVPNLALCEGFESAEVMVQHCSDDWQPLGVAGGYKTIEEAKRSVERSYSGIASKWVMSNANKQEAFAAYEAELQAESCSFCGRSPLRVTSMVGEEPRICNFCIDDFYEAIHEPDGKA